MSESIGWLILFGLAVVALWGIVSLQASLMASSRAEHAQEVQEMNAALDAAISYTPEPERTIESLAEQVVQMELRLRALEMRTQ